MFYSTLKLLYNSELDILNKQESENERTDINSIHRHKS